MVIYIYSFYNIIKYSVSNTTTNLWGEPMKTLPFYHILLPLFILALTFTSCDINESVVGTLDDAVQKVPDIQLVEGADNATITVQADRNRSNFIVNISNVQKNPLILGGTYNAWCIQMEVPVRIGQEITGTKLYSPVRDITFNMLNYIINKRSYYENIYAGLSWKDIQVSFWVIIETSDLNLETIKSKLPSFVEGYNEVYINNILNDVKTNGSNYTPGFGDTKLLILNSSGADQDLVFESCETAMARMYDDPYDFTFKFPDHSWFGYLKVTPTEEPQEFYFYAAQHIKVGQVYISRDANDLFIDIELEIITEDPVDYALSESQINVEISLEAYSELPQEWAFGNYPYKENHGPNGVSSYQYVIPFDSGWEGHELFIAIHGVVCTYTDNFDN
jgi:hypothetical protein